MGWVSPTGFVDGGGSWTSEILAYDEDTGTYASETIPAVGWGNYLELTHAAIDCDKVQIWCSYQANVDLMEVDVYYGGAWHNIYSGPATVGAYVEYPIGGTESVTAMRIRFSVTKKSRWVGVHEADFWEVEGAVYYHGLKVQGEAAELALCDVGNHPVRISKGGVTYGIEVVAVDDPNASRVRVKIPSGVRSIRKYT